MLKWFTFVAGVYRCSLCLALGGAFRKKNNAKEKVDQFLHKGSHVQIPGTFEVVDINVENNTALVRIDGKDYWLSSVPLLEVE